MRRIALVFVLTVGVLSAVEITALGGGNFQKWNTWTYSIYRRDESEPLNYQGFGYHAGGLISLRFTKPSSPAFIGLETGTSLIRINYVELVDSITTIIDGELIRILPEPNKRHFNKIIVPMLLKILVPTGNIFEWGAEIGPAIIYMPPQTKYTEFKGQEHELHYEGELDAGLEVKSILGVRIFPKIWLTPSVSMLYNLTADDKITSKLDTERFFVFSLGLALKL